MSNRFELSTLTQLHEVQALGVPDIFIDTDLGLDVEEVVSGAAGDVPQEGVDQAVSPSSVAESSRKMVQPVSLEEELEQAKSVRNDAQRAVRVLMDDVRMGRQVKIERVEHVVSSMVESILRNKDALLSMDLIRHRDRYTFEHCVSVAALLIAFGREMGLTEDVLHKLGVGGMLHDLGKAKVPDLILNKPGKLTDQEYEQIKQHVVYACEMVDELGLDPLSVQVIREHHERWDGGGYPNRLKGDEISLYGQMAAIVDVYDAVASHRIYHKGEAPTSVLKMLLEESDKHFNGELVQHFIHAVGIYPVGTLVRLDNAHLAVVISQGQEGLLYPILRVIFNAGSGSYVQPYVVNLSESELKIVGYENPESWGITPHVFVNR